MTNKLNTAKVRFEEPGSSIWQPYLDQAGDYDNELIEGWRDDMDSLLIFAALFSAIVATFSIESYKALQEDQGNVTIILLTQISQQLANVTANPASRPSSFKATPSAVVVNACWFLSLGFSLACSLGAVLVRQWARHYLQVPRQLSSRSGRARMRQYLYENMKTWRLELVVEMIPGLMHVSLGLFFVGLLLFLKDINFTVGSLMLVFCALSLATYTVFTISPLIFPGCPYQTPFSHLPILSLRIVWAATTLAITLLPTFFTAIAYLISWLFQQAPSIEMPPFRITRNAFWIANAPRQHQNHLPGLSNQPASHRLRLEIPDILGRVKRTLAIGLSPTQRRIILANNSSTVRDRNALRWVTLFSNKDGAVMDIIDSIPEFLESFDNPTIPETQVDLMAARSVLVDSGVVACIPQTLNMCVIGGPPQGTMLGMAVTCIEAMYWSIKCPANILRNTPSSHTPTLLPLSPVPFHIGTPRASFWQIWRPLTSGSITDSTIFFTRCAVAHLWLFDVCRSERLVQHWVVGQVGVEMYQTARCHLLELSITIKSYRTESSPSADIWESVHPFANMVSEILPPVPPLMNHEKLAILEKFVEARAELAFQILKTHVGVQVVASSSWAEKQISIVFAMLSDTTTHLLPHPRSSRDGQELVYRLVEWGTIYAQTAWRYKLSMHLRAAYGLVLFGASNAVPSFTRRGLETDFFGRVRVLEIVDEGTVTFHTPSADVVVSLQDYAAVLQKHHGETTSTIVGFLQCRLLHGQRVTSAQTGRPGSQHVAAVQEVLDGTDNPSLRRLLFQVAQEMGYRSALSGAENPESEDGK